MKQRLALVFALLAASIVNLAAQTYPSKVIKLVVPSAPGSPTDAVARVIAQQLQPRLGQSVIVENRPGAGQTTGTKAVAAAPADGYTLLLAGDVLAYFPITYPSLAFDPLKALTPIATAVTWSHVMVVEPSVPAKTIAELVAYAKANPGKLIFGLRFGTTPHILAEAFRQATGTDITFVPYSGGEQARADLLGGRVHLNFAPVANLISLIEDGRVRPLAYTGSARSPHLPDVPTMTESGFPQVGFKPDVWLGIFGPAGIPTAVAERLNSEVNASLKSPELKAILAKLGFEAKMTTPQEFGAFFAAEIQKWPPLLRAAGLKPE
jgi:tripartite-type tricarboxylate transporter receptor subunit TctC